MAFMLFTTLTIESLENLSFFQQVVDVPEYFYICAEMTADSFFEVGEG